jgi:trehalose 6-phosphate synthase/phosphatase
VAQVIIVSNRLPVSVKKVDGKLEFYPSTGGLATGLSSYVTSRRNRWIGWPGIPNEELNDKERRKIVKELAKYHCYPVFLTQKQLDDYYLGYSNSVLWPMLHNLPLDHENQTDHKRHYKAYREVNQLFAKVTDEISSPKSTIWVHDYLLLLLPQMLRKLRPADDIGFFMHIPFPTGGDFAKMPEAEALAAGMLGANLVGFHTSAYVKHFLDTCSRLEIGTVTPGQVLFAERVVQVTEFPMGIDYEKFAKTSRSRSVRKAARGYRRKYRGQRIILTVDRLDPTKGVDKRLEAYRDLLAANSKLRGKVVMVMVAVPSRTDIPAYKRLADKMERLVADTNKTYGTAKWQPVEYMYTTLQLEALTALYRVADIAFIAPIRDGMNLVAKEYIASKPHNRGILILSETAGAAEELTDALIVNPLKRSSVVAALDTALNMPKRELKRRAKNMQKHLSESTVQAWAGKFMDMLQAPIPGTPVLITRALQDGQLKEFRKAYKDAKQRLLLLDYDGVLVPLASDHTQAAPSGEVTDLLELLSLDKANEVVVVSGRRKSDLETWLGHLDRITLVAEHGAFTRRAGQAKWHKTSRANTPWKTNVTKLLESYAKKLPGSSVEVKEAALVWHYRGTSAYYAQKYLVVLKRLLRPIAKKQDLTVVNGHKILEVRARGVNKGVAAEQLLDKNSHDFIMAIGDDQTDEDTFTALPATAYTIKVGRGRTAARFRLESVRKVVRLLEKLT